MIAFYSKNNLSNSFVKFEYCENEAEYHKFLTKCRSITDNMVGPETKGLFWEFSFTPGQWASLQALVESTDYAAKER